MSQRFDSDNFIEAAKAYQRIQPPSGLREKVIEGAAAGVTERRVNRPDVMPRAAVKPSRRIYKLGTLAACIAVAVFSLQTWGPEGNLTDLLFGKGMPEASLIAIHQPEDSGNDAETENPAEPGTAADPAVPGDGDNLARMAEPVNNPEPAAAAEADAGEPAQAVYSPEEPVQAVMHREVPAPAEEKPEAADFEEEDPLEGLQEFRESVSEPVSVAAFFPTVLDAGISLEEWEVRLVSAQEGSCTVEITGAEGASALVTLLKNEENGQWEIKK